MKIEKDPLRRSWAYGKKIWPHYMRGEERTIASRGWLDGYRAAQRDARRRPSKKGKKRAK